MNIWLFYTIVALGSTAVFTAAATSQKRGAATVVAVFMALYVRAIQHFGPHIPWWHDGYFYFSIAESIHITGRAYTIPESVISWYAGAQSQSLWNAYQVITTIIWKVVGVSDPTLIQKFIPPLFGITLFTILYAFYSEFLDKDLGLAAAYIGVMMDPVIFYQSEYHNQGLAIVFVTFLLFVAYKTMSENTSPVRMGTIWLLASATFAITHHFTALMVSTVLGVVVFAQVAVSIASDTFGWKFDDLAIPRPALRTYLLYVIIMWVFASLIHYLHPLAIADGILGSLLQSFGLVQDVPSVTPVTQGGGSYILDRSSLILKVILVLLALPALLAPLFRKVDLIEKHLYYHLIAFGAMVPVIAVVKISVLPRVVLIGYLLLVPFSVAGGRSLPKPSMKTLVPVFVIIFLLGVAAGTTPSLIDYSSDIKSDGFEDIQPIGQQAPLAGDFVRDYIPDDKQVVVTFRTRMIGIMWGERGFGVEYQASATGEYWGIYDTQREVLIEGKTDTVYSNGRIVIERPNNADI